MKLLIEVVDGFGLPGKRTLRGRPYLYSPKMIVKVFLVMVFYRLTSVRSLARFLEQNRKIAKSCGLKEDLPSYRTLTRRFKTLDSVVISFARQILRVLIKHRVINLAVVATDGTLLEAKGRKAQRKRPEIRPSDPDARWGWSAARSWVFGYKLHLTSTVLGGGTLVPLCWTVTGANRHDTTCFIPLMKNALHLAEVTGEKTRLSLADKGYDCDDNYRWCSRHGQRLVTPVRRYKKKKISQIKLPALAFAKTKKGKELYKRRADNERLISQLKEVFLIDPLPAMRKENVAPYLSLVNLAYLLGVLYNHLNGRSIRAIKSLAA